jgi:hypothetical protein
VPRTALMVGQAGVFPEGGGVLLIHLLVYRTRDGDPRHPTHDGEAVMDGAPEILFSCEFQACEF